jgi:CBS domain containing-hemolysin-like protein
VAGLVFVLRPLLVVTRAIARAFTKGAVIHPVTSIEEITLLASLGRTEGVVTTVTADMIEGVAALRDLRARDVMVPRARVVYLSGQRTFAENLDVVRRSNHSRFPYSNTGDLDQVEGIVLVKDLMFDLLEAGKQAVDLSQLAGKPLVVPATTTLERLLRNFQMERRHMAIVVDEYGGTEGIVTLEDVLEEIVGEIEDESDRVDRLVTKRADGTLVCRGWAEARSVLDELGVDLDVDAVTIGGLVAELVGRVPRPGDEVDWHGLHFLVTQASPRRAERVEIRRSKKEEAVES